VTAIGISKATRTLGRIVRAVSRNRQPAVLARRGKPVAAIVPVEFLDRGDAASEPNGIGSSLTHDHSDQRFRDFAEAASDWFWEMDEEFRFTWFSDRFEAVLGLNPDERIGQSRFSLMIADDDRSEWERHKADLQAHRPFRDFTYEYIDTAGLRRTIRVHGKPVFDADGAFRGYRGSGSDMTAEVNAQRQAEHAMTLLSEATENMAQGLVAFDNDLTILLSNRRAVELLDAPAELLAAGKSFADFIRFAAKRGDYGKGDPEELIARFSATARGTLRHNFERELPNGVFVEVRARPLPGGGFITSYTEITERKQIEKQLRKLNKRLEEHAMELKRSNTELEQFAYVASHDLQEPLRMVSSYCQLLQRRYADRLDQDANEFIEFAVNGAQRMQRLINDLLAFSRVGTRANDLQPLACDEALSEARENLQATIAETGAEIRCRDLPMAMADRTQLVQLFQNLIGNAIKFRRDEPPRVEISAQRENGHIKLSVTDNGLGIESEYADRVFMIFQRLHAATDYPGTGIGLAVCKKIVERHGGRIWFESTPGRGTCFHFTLTPADEGLSP